MCGIRKRLVEKKGLALISPGVRDSCLGSTNLMLELVEIVWYFISLRNLTVGNNGCGGNDGRWGVYAAELNGSSEDTKFALY